MPATTAIGTARISGHGVATISTVRARIGSPVIAHAPPAIASVTGMKIAAYRSARRTERRLLAFGIPNQPDDAGVGALLGGCGRPQVEPGAGVHRAGSNEIVLRAIDGPRLAGQRRLVEHRVAQEHAVDRHDLPRLHEQALALTHFIHRAFHELAVLVPRHDPGGPGEQGGQLFVGPTISEGLEGLSGGEHQGDHRSGEVLGDASAATIAMRAIRSTPGSRRRRPPITSRAHSPTSADGTTQHHHATSSRPAAAATMPATRPETDIGRSRRSGSGTRPV